jgi:uncharacterized membrane protein YkoI
MARDPHVLQLRFTAACYEESVVLRRNAMLLALVAALGLGACERGTGDDGAEHGVDLVTAIAIAQDDLPEGLPVDAELTEFEGAPAYDVDLFVGGETRELFVDTQTGEIVGRLIDPDDFADAALAADALAASDVSLADAIEIAQDVVDGDAVAAELDDALAAIEIVMVLDTDTRVVSVSLADGTPTVE